MKAILTIYLSILSFASFALFKDDTSKPFGEKRVEKILKQEQKNLLETEKNNISIYNKFARSVVNVSNIKLARTGWFMDYHTSEVPTGAGSGFVWDDQGHIVTNYHVIEGGSKFLISFKNDKKQYKAKLVGKVPQKDIAVLKLEEKPTNLYPVNLGDSSQLLVGQKALAIGNPFGLDHTLTTGIVSALERQIKGIGNVTIKGMIQSDCSINPGNSGGPLLDSLGRVIGMNTMIYSHSGTSAGVGFAVPINTIKTNVKALIRDGKVIRPGLGIALAENYVKYHFGIEKGIVIKVVSEGSSAEKAGLQGMTRDQYGRYYIGDIILKIDTYEINSYDDIYNALDNYKVGDSVKVTYERDGKKKTTRLKLMKI